MFDLNIIECSTPMIEVKENGNVHGFPLIAEKWTDADFYHHWALESYSLAEDKAIAYLFTGMRDRGSKRTARAFRVLRTRGSLLFDDVLVGAPLWSGNSPDSLIEYANNPEYPIFNSYHCAFDEKDETNFKENRIPEFSVSMSELRDWLWGDLQKKMNSTRSYRCAHRHCWSYILDKKK